MDFTTSKSMHELKVNKNSGKVLGCAIKFVGELMPRFFFCTGLNSEFVGVMY
jgi:hypothetical protein